MSIFNIGDKVTWTSQSSSVEKTKTGTVVMTMQRAIDDLGSVRGGYPTRVADEVFPNHKRMFDGMSWPTAKVMVEVIDTKRGKPKLYMPNAKNLGRVIE